MDMRVSLMLLLIMNTRMKYLHMQLLMVLTTLDTSSLMLEPQQIAHSLSRETPNGFLRYLVEPNMYHSQESRLFLQTSLPMRHVQGVISRVTRKLMKLSHYLREQPIHRPCTKSRSLTEMTSLTSLTLTLLYG